MLDREAIQILRGKLNAELPRRRQLFETELQRAQSDMGVRGLGHSGALVQAVADVCATEVENSAGRLWEIMRPLLDNTRTAPSDDAVGVLRGQIDELFLTYCATEARTQFQEIIRRAGMAALGNATGFEGRLSGACQGIHLEADQVIRSLRQRTTIPKTT